MGPRQAPALGYNPYMLTKRLLARLLSRSQGSAFPRGTQDLRGVRASWRATAYLYTPLLSIFVFLFVMGLIFWTLTRREQQQQEDTLYRNVAWAQQQFRLSLTNTQDQVGALARDIAIGHADTAALNAPTQDMLSSHPEIVALRWLNPAGEVRWDAMPTQPPQATDVGNTHNVGVPGGAPAPTNPAPGLTGPIGRMRTGVAFAASAPPETHATGAVSVPASSPALAWAAAASATASHSAAMPKLWQPPRLLPPLDGPLESALFDVRDSRRVGYSPVFFDTFGHAYFTQQTPIFANRTFVGAIVVVFSIDGMLHRELPPELSSRFKISILDDHDRELASSSSRPRLARDPYLDLPLDPPGNGLSVRVYTYGQHTSSALLNNRLLWLVAGLSCFVLWSLWNVWKHTRQRFVAQQQLYDEASFRRAMENSVLVGMRVLDLQGRILYVNPAFCRMTGWDESDLVGTAPPYAYWPPESFTEMRRQIDMTLRGKAPSSGFEMRVRRKDGSTFHARMYVSPLIDGSGRQTGWMSSMTDISEPRRVREELTAAQQRFTTVLEGLDAAVSVLATDATQLLYANRYYRHIFGLRPQGHLELANALERDVGGSEDGRSDSIDMIDTYAGMPAAFSGENDDPARESAVSQEVFVQSVQRWFDVRRQYIQWVDGHLAQMQIATDITARKQAEENARQQDEKLQFASRLSTMGEMASSLAHELNQPLAAISNYCSGASAMVRNNRASPEMLLGALEKTSQQALRAGMIIKRIREFVKRSEPKRKEVRIGDIVADAIGLAEIETRRRGIRISTEMRGNLPAISVDPVLIEQVLVNLLKNAAEAMSEMRDTAPRSTIGPLDNVVQLVASNDPDMVRVSVIDHGPGVDETTAERLFEPFYSTKSDGMGMGLNICRSIIESHRGRLWVENNLTSDGKITGCTFHCTLPIAPARARDGNQADTYPFLNPTTLRENHE
jgi:PAS domain S-box-containing protein